MEVFCVGAVVYCFYPLPHSTIIVQWGRFGSGNYHSASRLMDNATLSFQNEQTVHPLVIKSMESAHGGYKHSLAKL